MDSSSYVVENDMGNQLISPDAYHDVSRAKLPIELIESIIELSHVSSLKAWTSVCRTLLPSARYQLFTQSTLCLRGQSHATDFTQWFSNAGTLPAGTGFVRSLRLRGAPEDSECWFADILEKLDDKLDNVQTLTMDFTGVPVRSAIFARLTGLCCQYERTGITPLPNLRHLEMIGADTTAAYRVLETVTLFPRLETLKLKSFRWNVVNGLFWIPFPPLLRHIEADIEEVVNPAAFMFALFGESEKQQEITTFSLRVNNDHAKTLSQFDDAISQAQHRNYFVQILKALDRVMPEVQYLKLDVPMDDISPETDTRAYLNQHGLLRNLKTLTVNDVEVIKADN